MSCFWNGKKETQIKNGFQSLFFLFFSLYELAPYFDITFEIKDRLFRAHKCILAARSEYFRLKFENKWKDRTWIVGSHELVNFKS